MLVNFGRGKCPVCGDSGKKLKEETFACMKCNVVFDAFSITFADELPEDIMNYYWT